MKITWDDFKDFMMMGNVIDLAIAVVIGAAFGAIISSLVDDIFMPIIGALLGGVDFTSLSIQVGEAVIRYGNFIQAIVEFLLIALALFLIVRAYTRFIKQEAASESPAQPTAEEQLLTEIRDILKSQSVT